MKRLEEPISVRIYAFKKLIANDESDILKLVQTHL
jgi:hypothetical protein